MSRKLINLFLKLPVYCIILIKKYKFNIFQKDFVKKILPKYVSWMLIGLLLVNLRFSLHCKRIQRWSDSKKWIYLERNTFHRQEYWPSQMMRERKRERVRLGDITGLGCMDWVISLANEWEDYSNYLGDGAEVSSPSFALWWSASELSWHWWVCHSAYVLWWTVWCSSRFTGSWIFCHLGPIWF